MKLESAQKTSFRGLWFPLLLLLAGFARADDPFPRPVELQPDVDFWVSIFTAYRSDEGVLHDNRNLAVVYARIDMPADLSRRERQRRIESERKSVQAVLRRLATGKREALDATEARILALWGEDVSNETLAAAVDRIRFQQGLSDRFREGMQRSGRWRDYVHEQFTALGVPPELVALPHVESSYNPDARSHVGASGIWQFTRSTGRRFMRVDHVVDERNDPFAATRAAARLLAYNYSITGNWPMAITAYNHGLSGVRRAMQRYGDTATVDILRHYDGRTFGFASRNFYVAFLAAVEVDRNAERYFPGIVSESPQQYAVARLPRYVSAGALSQALGMPKGEIARHNPGLQSIVWEGSKYLPKGYELRVPAGGIDGSLDALLAGLPADAVFDEQLPDLFHTVARGDTLSEIAEAYDTRVSTLVALNNLGSQHRIRAGQQLRLPAAGPAPEVQVVEAVAVVEAPPTVAVVAALAGEADVDEPVAVETAVEAPSTIAAVAALAGAADVDEPVAVETALETALEEPVPAMLGDETSQEPAVGSVQASLLSDPSDYSVADDATIEVQPLETLGHYGDWLEIKTQRLRDLNGLAFRTPVEVGQRVRLDLGKVDAARFEARRIAFQRSQQDSFFRQHVITGVADHTIAEGESVWVLALRRYGVPLWLFRQYNPLVDLQRVQPGTRVQIPLLAAADAS